MIRMRVYRWWKVEPDGFKWLNLIFLDTIYSDPILDTPHHVKHAGNIMQPHITNQHIAHSVFHIINHIITDYAD